MGNRGFKTIMEQTNIELNNIGQSKEKLLHGSLEWKPVHKHKVRKCHRGHQNGIIIYLQGSI